LTEARIAQLAEAKKKQAIVLDHSQANERKLGTVGAVARDRSGNLAAATSTGGLVNQQWGRVGAAEVQSNSDAAKTHKTASPDRPAVVPSYRRIIRKCGIGPLDHVASAVQIRAEAEHVFSVSSRGDVRKFVAHDPGLQIRGLNHDPASANPWLCLPASNSAATS
jgi:hypothetical protein